jgi:GT2 family glycosyltransferase
MADPRELMTQAAAAWQQGLTAGAAGDNDNACLWFERAARLAPNDPRIALDLANRCIALGGPARLAQAAAACARVAERYDALAAWLGLLVARRLGGGPGADAALVQILARHCLPADPAFPQLAGAIARDCGAPGWCGMLASGAVHAQAPPGARLVFELDGAKVTPARLEDGFAIPAGRRLAVCTGDGKALLGSPLDLAALRRVEGVVSVIDGALIGWASRPAAPEAPCSLTLRDAAGREKPVVFGSVLPPDDDAPFARRASFVLPAGALKDFMPPYSLTGPEGAEIFGSPVDPGAAARTRPVAADLLGAACEILPPRAPLTVVVPVYRGLSVTRACLDALLAALPAGARVVVVDDASPEPALSSWLDGLAAAGRILLFRHEKNLGFPAAANAGIERAGGGDVLLLNSDTLVPPGAIEALAEAAYGAASTGSATPFSNEATILSYPDRNGGNPAPEPGATARLQALAALANGGQTLEIPVGIGFCLFMRHDCLKITGGLRSDLYAQGYGEENDWCLRARQHGFRHVAALGAYVAHHGGVSFGAAGRALNRRNAKILNLLFPGYDRLIAAHIKADPLAPARRRLDAARFAAGRNAAGAVLLISHNHGGGVARMVEAGMQAVRAAGRRPILLFPGAPADPKGTPFPWDSELTDGKPGDYPGLRFALPRQQGELLAVLREENIEYAVLHHGLGQHAVIRTLAAALGVPQDMVLHDYASFCPRVNLLSKPDADAPLRYCGEPNLAGCEACVAIAGDETFEELGPARLIARSKQEFAAARRIIVPSPDAAARIRRHFPAVQPEITAWEDDRLPVSLAGPRGGARRVAVIGGIGPAKGYDILLECGRDARRRNLGLEFFIAGASADDAPLLATGRIFITGAYAEGEATALIRGLAADLAFLPSIWPETWCFALSEAWRAGLYTLAFDLGAQAARIRATGRGAVLPLGLPAPRINDILLAWQPDRKPARNV